LLREDVCVTGADSIDEMLTLIPGLPDLNLVLLDASMRGMENFAGLKRLVEKLSEVPIVVTSPSESSAQIVAAIRGGARGYFSPSTKVCVLRHALPLILSGEIYIPACALRLEHGNGMLRPEGLAARMGNAGGKLTPRQCEIVVLLGEGKSNKEIAREAKVLEGTVKLHVRGILRKLGVRNRTEAVLAAARGGYLSRETSGVEAPMSRRTTAHADHKVPKSRERNRHVLKTIVGLCVGWCSLSASFELCIMPLPERNLIKWGTITTGGVLTVDDAAALANALPPAASRGRGGPPACGRWR
jgi:two-component system, NarL family, nitrate/nitrite response regulator NarL